MNYYCFVYCKMMNNYPAMNRVVWIVSAVFAMIVFFANQLSNVFGDPDSVSKASQRVFFSLKLCHATYIYNVVYLIVLKWLEISLAGLIYRPPKATLNASTHRATKNSDTP